LQVAGLDGGQNQLRNSSELNRLVTTLMMSATTTARPLGEGDCASATKAVSNPAMLMSTAKLVKSLITS
jgi:hypothetical protein